MNNQEFIDLCTETENNLKKLEEMMPKNLPPEKMKQYGRVLKHYIDTTRCFVTACREGLETDKDDGEFGMGGDWWK